MQHCTRLRVLRLKHEISLTELARAAGVSSQYMSRVELGQEPPTRALEKKCEAALEKIIRQRHQETLALEYTYRIQKGGLLKEWEENRYER